MTVAGPRRPWPAGLGVNCVSLHQTLRRALETRLDAKPSAAARERDGEGEGGVGGASTVESTRSHVPLAAGSDAEGL